MYALLKIDSDQWAVILWHEKGKFWSIHDPNLSQSSALILVDQLNKMV